MPMYEREQARLRSYDAQVVGVSTDTRPSLAAWATSLGGISYPLLSDFWPHGEVAQRYGVFVPDRGMAERALVVVGSDGLVKYVDVHELREVPDEAALFEVLASLAGG